MNFKTDFIFFLKDFIFVWWRKKSTCRVHIDEKGTNGSWAGKIWEKWGKWQTWSHGCENGGRKRKKKEKKYLFLNLELDCRFRFRFRSQILRLESSEGNSISIQFDLLIVSSRRMKMIFIINMKYFFSLWTNMKKEIWFGTIESFFQEMHEGWKILLYPTLSWILHQHKLHHYDWYLCLHLLFVELSDGRN